MSPHRRPLVLLSNDDGFTAPGLIALRDELARYADVVVCSPEANQSATSHSLTLHRVLRLRRIGDGTFAVDGTPADCIYVALHAAKRVLPRRPDLVVSGMNHGLNLGVDAFYSGTVAAAREGALRGLPSIAVSADMGAARPAAAALGARVAIAVLETYRQNGGGRPAPLFNMNIPRGPLRKDGDEEPGTWEVRATRIGSRLYEEDVVFRTDPRGHEYLWIGGSKFRHDHVAGSDTEAFDAGAASLTPLTLDLTAETGLALATDVAARCGAARND